MTYTLDDLKRAQDNLARLEELWDNYTGNNPNNYRAARGAGRSILVPPEPESPGSPPVAGALHFHFAFLPPRYGCPLVPTTVDEDGLVKCAACERENT
jgi:hypothetical protein